MSFGLDPVVALVVRICLAMLFAGAALHKVRSPRTFRAALAGFAVVPPALLGVVAFGVIVTEVVTTTLLVARPALGGLAAAGLLGAYAGAMALALARGRHGVECGCGGPAGTQPLHAGLIVRNLLLAVPALLLSAPPVARAVTWLDVVTVAGSVAAATALLAAANVLLATAPRIAELHRMPEGA